MSRWARLDHGQRRAGLQRGVDEIMAVMHVALDGEIGLARLDGAAVDGKPDDAVRQRAVGRGAHRLAPSPAMSRASSRSCDPRRERGRDRLVIAERQRLVADDLAGLVALAGDQQRIARLQAPRSRRGSPARGRRSPSRPWPRRGSRRGSLPASRCADCRR